MVIFRHNFCLNNLHIDGYMTGIPPFWFDRVGSEQATLAWRNPANTYQHLRTKGVWIKSPSAI